MSALGHSRTFAVQNGMSALPPIADIARTVPPDLAVALLPLAIRCAAGVALRARLAKFKRTANP